MNPNLIVLHCLRLVGLAMLVFVYALDHWLPRDCLCHWLAMYLTIGYRGIVCYWLPMYLTIGYTGIVYASGWLCTWPYDPYVGVDFGHVECRDGHV